MGTDVDLEPQDTRFGRGKLLAALGGVAAAGLVGPNAARAQEETPTHTHEIADVNGLQAALDGKADDADLDGVARLGSQQAFTALQELQAGLRVGDGSGARGNARITFPTQLNVSGPGNIDYTEKRMNGVVDPILFMAINTDAHGIKHNPDQPAIGFGVEGNYFDGQKTLQEAYITVIRQDFETEFAAGRPGIFRPLMCTHDKGTNAVAIGLRGTTTSFADEEGNTEVLVTRNRMTMYAPDQNTDTVFRVRAAPAKTAWLSLGQNGVDDILTIRAAASNRVDISVNTAANALRIYEKPQGGTAGGSISVGGVSDTQAVGVFAVNTNARGVKGLVTRGRADQVGNLFEAQAADGTVHSTISENGYMTTRKTSAPADGELVNGEAAFWFDASNGNPKFMIKAKDANGRVRTGSVDLS